ncbi:MAG: hypothetical protein ABII06_17060, partial [Pseudomonadota bacterium]
MNYHGIILQAPRVCSTVTLSTSVGKGRSVEYQGFMVEFSRITPKLFEGFSFDNGVYMALPEKAILDTLYFHGKIPAEDEIEVDDVDIKALLNMSDKYPATIRRHVREF